MIVTADFETMYSQAYSLTKMTTAEYITSPLFQPIMLALKVGDGASEIHIGKREIQRRLDDIDWANAAWLSHHTRFDGAILNWIFGKTPKMYLDTLSMARAVTHWNTGRSSLKAVSDYLGLPPKGDEVVRAIGKRLEDFTPIELQAYADYCVRDMLNCREIFDRLRPIFQHSELQLIDLIIRMYIIPQVKLNPSTLAEHLAQVQAEKAQALGRVAHIDKSVFSSNQKFAALLEEHGVEVPMKISSTTGLEIPAIAKNDRAFKELCMDDSQPVEVQALLAARLGVKSTLEETRTSRLLGLAQMSWPPVANAPTGDALVDDIELRRAMEGLGIPGARETGWAAVPLKYSAARTHRLGGDDFQNWQNLRRGGRIKDAIEAPAGYRIVHRDASQIEARMTAWLAKCQVLLDAFAQGRDVYSEFATIVYGRHITKADRLERFVGKTGILGLGYGCGPPKFRHMLFIGNGGVSYNATPEEAQKIVYRYRDTYGPIPLLWSATEVLLRHVAAISRGLAPRGLLSNSTVTAAALGGTNLNNVVTPAFDALFLPNNLCIAYPNIRVQRNPQDNKPEMVYDDPYGSSVKLYGAKGVENISQAASRIVVTDIAVRTYAETGRHPFLSTHDSLDYCVPESEVEWWNQWLTYQFALRPSWAPDLPLASDGGWGVTLLAAENEDDPRHNQ